MQFSSKMKSAVTGLEHPFQLFLLPTKETHTNTLVDMCGAS